MIRRAGPALAVWVGLVAIAFSGAPRRCTASTEEFSTFDVEAQEEDDESLLDHYATRLPREWRDEWERGPQAIRTSQGCLTSGQWFIDTDLKLRSPLGGRARFELDFRQSQSDAASYENFDFAFKFPTRFGTPGVMFRPLYEKSRQDFAATYDIGADTSRYQVEAVFTLEDMFNNLWEFRQSRVGQDSEPYEKHPYEPALRLVTRQKTWRAEISGRYLTPSTKLVRGLGGGPTQRVVTLWGSYGYASLEVDALGLEWEARGINKQALGSDEQLENSTGDHHNYRRLWAAELKAGRRLTRRLRAETHFIYQSRDQEYGAPSAASFAAIDRMVTADAWYALTPRLSARVGGLYDRISVDQTGPARVYSFGDRTESRAIVGLEARFGRVHLEVIEGIELDPESYDVAGVHDKGFLHLQTTF